MRTASIARQLPQANVDTQQFWDACLRDELVLQKCTACGALRHPPSPICPECLDDRHEWIPASGRGTVYTFVVVRQSLAKGWDELIPYVVAVIDLEEGPKFLTDLINVDPHDVTIGMPVEVIFEAAGDGVKMPYFQPQTAPAA